MPGPSKYRSALASAAVIQVMFLLAASTTLDSGMAIRVVLIAAALFWAATYVIVRRYRQAPGALALGFIRVGCLGVLLVVGLVAGAVWHFSKP